MGRSIREMANKLTSACVSIIILCTAGADAVADQFVGINAITLATTNMTASRHFYGLLGLNCTYGCQPTSNWTTFGTRDFVTNSFHINLYPASPPLPPDDILYVRSVDDVYVSATAAGLKAEFAPKDADWGERYFQILDPSGHELAIAQPLSAPLAT